MENRDGEQNKRQKIEAAYAKLEILQDAQNLVGQMIDVLARIPYGQKGTDPGKFRVTGQTGAQKELKVISKRAGELAKCMRGLSETAFTVLADQGLLQVIRREDLQNLLDQVAQMAQRADVSQIPQKQGSGRQTDNLAAAVARILASDYEKLTEKRPGVTRDAHDNNNPKGTYYCLVRDVFEALGLPETSAQTYARQAVEERRRGH